MIGINASTCVTNATQIPTIMGSPVPFSGNLILDIFVISLVASLFVTIANKYLSDQDKIRELKEEMKRLRKESRKHMTKNPQKAQAIQQEMMQKNFENMKHTMNPKVLIVTMLPIGILFTVVRASYGPCDDFFNAWFTTWGWFGVYFLFSIINSIMLKKILDVA